MSSPFIFCLKVWASGQHHFFRTSAVKKLYSIFKFWFEQICLNAQVGSHGLWWTLYCSSTSTTIRCPSCQTFFSLSLTFQGLVLDNLLKPGLLFVGGGPRGESQKKRHYLSFKNLPGPKTGPFTGSVSDEKSLIILALAWWFSGARQVQQPQCRRHPHA